MDALDRTAIGHRVATLRLSRRLSTEAAAQLAGRSRRWLYDVEAGRAALSVEGINGLAAAFDVSPAVIECIDPIPDPKAEAAEMRRRDFLRGAAGMLGTMASGRLVDLWESDSRSVTSDQVVAIESLTKSLRELDNQFGGGYSRSLARSHLDSSVCPMIRARSYDPDVGTQLLRAGSHLAHLAGWMSFDISQPDAGARLLEQARELALAVATRSSSPKSPQASAIKCCNSGTSIQLFSTRRTLR